MKNKYEIRGDTTAIFIQSKKYGNLETLIETKDLELVQKMPFTWIVHYSPQGRTLYVAANIYKDNGKRTSAKLHRWIMSPNKSDVVDHINHNTLDNRRSNLRVITTQENQQNRKASNKNSITGVRGVSYRSDLNKYRARVYLQRQLAYSEHFDTLEEAEKAVKIAREKLMDYTTN